ncbi:MAG: uracil-DNA glycosylase [Rhodoferax sp.]|nr:uracil-DNA glycosylase [Rhodoferax sp.]MDP3653444.1 uracil-DNA glycosylase [Rhodoferax sp.]
MALELDARQRAMLQEMGVHVWLPGTAFAAEPALEAAVAPGATSSAVVQSSPAHLSQPRVPAVAPSAPPVAGSAPTAPPLARVPAPPAAAQPPAHAPGMGAMAGMDWAQLADAAAQCQACGLCAGRKNTTLQVPEVVVQADWMVVGDPPDEAEDRLGQPFADQPGILLDNMLKAVGASRSGSGAAGAYLSNVVKCRPPHGHIPQAQELAQCAAYLQREIALVQPKIIVAMGRFATQLLLGAQPALASQPLGKLRGTVYRYQGIPVVVTYHPKVLLRASSDKAKAWADLCLAMATLEPSLQ